MIPSMDTGPPLGKLAKRSGCRKGYAGERISSQTAEGRIEFSGDTGRTCFIL